MNHLFSLPQVAFGEFRPRPDDLSLRYCRVYRGKPLRFRRLPDGVVIYAVGFDLTDDGGKLDRVSRLPGSARAAAPATGVDVGVRLWDASCRRQSSMPKPVTQPGNGQTGAPTISKS